MRQIFKDAICLFHPKDIHFFWANYRFCRKSGNDADSKGGGGGGEGSYSLRYYDVMRMKIDM